MKNRSLFLQIIFLILVGVICLLVTVGVSLLAGAVDRNLFDFRNINFANMIPVLLIGIFISCVIVGICILFVGKTAFFKIQDFFKENNNGGKNK